jgi:hypothetical protein
LGAGPDLYILLNEGLPGGGWLFMKFDEREATPITFVGDGSNLPEHVIEEGDEAVLFHDGKLIMANISSLKGNQMVGTVTRSAYEPDLHPELTIGKEIYFLEENIFGISKMTKKD